MRYNKGGWTIFSGEMNYQVMNGFTAYIPAQQMYP
jgi:hypothetical protein